ncbi:hypothetical protein [Nocardia nova]|uniref:hypothetical protein n=1 Tax=Nocardia nova TaxID=37330 RepID=UPI0033FD512A
MSGELRLDLTGLRERAARLADIADRVQQTHAGLRGCLEQADGSWGDDHMGRAFAEQFTPHADQVVASVQAMVESLRSTASGIAGTANEFAAQDADNATRVAGAADDPGSGDRTGTQPEPAAGPAAPADQPGSTARDAVAPEQKSPVYPPGGQQRTGQQPDGRNRPGGTPSLDGAPGADSGRQSQAPWNRSRPDPGSASSAGPGAPGQRTGSVSPASGAGSRPTVSAPADGRNTPGAAGGNRAAGRGDTPWSGQSPRTPGRPRTPGTPGNAERPGNTGTNPRHGSPPRPNAPAGNKGREGDRRNRSRRPATDPAIERLARALAERHGVQVTGFDTPGLQLPAVRDFVNAVDRVLTEYPMITLDVVAVAELDDELGPVRWSCEPPGIEGGTRSITLDRRTAQQPDTPAPDVSVATLRAFARAFDAAGGGVARRQAQRVLISEYLSTLPRPRPTLSAVVRGYRDWRAESAGNLTAAGEFDVDLMLGAAFADVVQHGEKAGIQARLLHAVLVAAASRPG